MKIGFNLMLWTDHVCERIYPVIEKLKATGYDGVEIPILDVSDPGHYGRIGRFLRDTGLEATASTVLPDALHNAISADAGSRRRAGDYLRRVIECGREAGVQVLCGPYYQALGQFTGKYPAEEELQRAAAVHSLIAREAQAANIRCAIEVLNRFEAHLLNTIGRGIDYVKRVNHPGFGLMYDTFHANIEEKDPLGAIDAAFASGKLFHVHISENDRGTPGRGHIDLSAAIARLKQVGYDGWLTIEAFGGSLAGMAAATRVWRDFFPSVEQVYKEGFSLIKQSWENA